jgi:arginyl-tRNA--protein-N-Asp/Glu arginylyltransferase
MSQMTEDDFISMIEISSLDSYMMEFRDNFNNLLGVILMDIHKKNLSAVYSFFNPDYSNFGLGNFMITKCLMYGKDNDHLISEIWRPKWTTITDPSARLLIEKSLK